MHNTKHPSEGTVACYYWGVVGEVEKGVRAEGWKKQMASPSEQRKYSGHLSD